MSVGTLRCASARVSRPLACANAGRVRCSSGGCGRAGMVALVLAKLGGDSIAETVRAL